MRNSALTKSTLPLTAIIAALMSSICCWGPFVAVFFGLSLDWLPIRSSTHVILALVSIKIMVVLYLMKPRKCSEGVPSCCVPKKSRFKSSLWVPIALMFVAMPYLRLQLDESPISTRHSLESVERFHVPQISCQGCAVKIKTALAEHYPMWEVSVDVNRKVLVIADSSLTHVELLNAVSKIVQPLGYDITRIEAS